ncbi:hypothetical protein ABW19_dt0207687 [Dactylella cylindrospora]|nr:hypothetical protein ABW19_dt0207687 [Dactylella cylindrospora]
MAQILRQIVAGPRIKHPETGLDLVYVTDNIIAMSMPAASTPKIYYRNPLHKVVEFLDKEHGENWAVWEFRAEGTGYDDSAFYNRVFHSPWPDHHPPPFALIPNIMASMRNHLKQGKEKVAVVHCKAGKGRTGTVTCSYLISEEGWSKDAALERFTKKRMRPQFGAGVSIPSQLRYVDYVSQWVTIHNKIYVERSIEIIEVHLWGLRENVKIALLGYVDEGKTIKNFHSFTKEEKTLVDVEEGRDKEIVSALAHCWFNCYFEGGGASTTSGVFTQEWEKMDGLKGTSKKGIRIFDKVQIVWKVVEGLESHTIKEPEGDEPVEGTHKASEDRGETEDMDPLSHRDLGLRPIDKNDEGLSTTTGTSTLYLNEESSNPSSLTSSVKDLVLKDRAAAEREYRGETDDSEEECEASTSSIRPSESASVAEKQSVASSSTTAATSKTGTKDSISSPSTGEWTTSDSSVGTTTTAVDGADGVVIQRTTSPDDIGSDPARNVGTLLSNSTALPAENSAAPATIAEETGEASSSTTPTPHIITASTGNGEVLVSTEPERDALLGHRVGTLVHDDPKEMAN